MPLTVPGNAQTQLAALSDQQLAAQLRNNARDLAYCRWEAARRGWTVITTEEKQTGVVNNDQTLGLIVTIRKVVEL